MAIARMASLTQMSMPRLAHMRRHLTLRNLIAIIIPMLLLSACSVGDLSGTSSTSTTGTGVPSDACVGGKPAPTSSGDLGTPISGGTLSGTVAGDTPVHLNIALNVNRQSLDACLKSIYDPASANYRQFLSPSDIAKRFAPSDADVAKITQYLTSQGLTVSQTYKTNAALTIDGRASQVQKAFNVQLQNYTKGSGTYYAPDKAPTLPSDLQGIVASISGLITNTPVNCQDQPTQGPFNCQYIRPSGGLVMPTASQIPAHSSDVNCAFATTGTPLIGGGSGAPLLTWNELRSAYGLDKLAQQGYDGGNTSIGMVEFDSYATDDIVEYEKCANTYAPGRLVNVDVVPGVASQTPVGEATLDVELAAGLTGKNTKIITYNAPNNAQWESEFQDILQRVASDKQVSVLSISYGDFEQDLTPTYRESVNDTMKLLATEGISVFVASGDCGAFGAGQFGANVVDFPASAPWSIGVGGTDLSVDAVSGARTSEQVWGNSSPDKTACNNTWGSGGGLSGEPSFTIPSWQKGTGVSNSYSNGARQVPDVSAAAINISIFFSGALPGVGGLWLMTGGTSAAAPIWATGIDIVNQALAAKGKNPFGGVPVIYQLANSSNSNHVLNDVTKGNNQYFQATPGWDFATGWGSPNFDQIAAALGA